MEKKIIIKPKNLSLTMDELLTIVKSEVLQLDYNGKEKVIFAISKMTCYESGEEVILVKILRKEEND